MILIVTSGSIIAVTNPGKSGRQIKIYTKYNETSVII